MSIIIVMPDNKSEFGCSTHGIHIQPGMTVRAPTPAFQSDRGSKWVLCHPDLQSEAAPTRLSSCQHSSMTDLCICNVCWCLLARLVPTEERRGMLREVNPNSGCQT